MAFIKPFEALQGSVKIKIKINFLSSSRIGTGRVKLGTELNSFYVVKHKVLRINELILL